MADLPMNSNGYSQSDLENLVADPNITPREIADVLRNEDIPLPNLESYVNGMHAGDDRWTSVLEAMRNPVPDHDPLVDEIDAIINGGDFDWPAEREEIDQDAARNEQGDGNDPAEAGGNPVDPGGEVDPGEGGEIPEPSWDE